MNAKDYILLEYEALEEGCTLSSEECPSCHGGDSGERKLSVSRRNGRLLWICHRASCGFKGASWAHATPGQGVAAERVVRHHGAADAVPEAARRYVQERYGITEQMLYAAGAGWTTEHSVHDKGRLFLPVRDWNGKARGYVARALDKQQPKALTFSEGGMAWYPNRKSGTILAVEDQLSAIKARAYCSTVALLGTLLNEERAREIKSTGVKRVLLALDRDAFPTAVRHVVAVKSIIPIQLLPLTKDVKDMMYEDIEEMLNGNDASSLGST